MSLFDRERSAERLPLALITGFLGSGKTTLLNRLLQRPEMADTAVVINEFGEIGLDHLMVETVDGEMVVMASGCLCCTVRSDLEQTLRSILARRDRGEVPRFRRILVETTGLADPAPIAQMLLNNPLLTHYLRLDAIVTTVDAVHGSDQLDRHWETVRQAALADRLVLTKVDLAAGPAVEALQRRLAALNPGAVVHVVQHGEIEPALLFGAGPVGQCGEGTALGRWLNEAAYAGAAEEAARGHGHAGHSHDHGGATDRNRHDERIRAICLTASAPLDWMAFNGWLAEVRARHGQQLLRVKGVLNLADETAPVVVHGVHHVFHPPTVLDRWPDSDRRSRLVVIVQDLASADIEDGWRALTGALAQLQAE